MDRWASRRSALAAVRAGGPSRVGFVARELRLGRRRHRYGVYVPSHWDGESAWPVVLFLHGAGERGLDGTAPTRVGLGPALRAYPDRFPAVVAFPQCLPGRSWTHPDMLDIARAALEAAIGEFHGDVRRVVLTGISMGGYGSWEMAAREPSRFACLAVVCGGIARQRPSGPLDAEDPRWWRSDYVETGRRLVRLPAWVFHGDRDDIIPVEESRTAVAVLRRLGGDVRYTEYAGVDHFSWDRAYAEPELPAWMFACERAGPETVASDLPPRPAPPGPPTPRPATRRRR